MKTLVAVRNSQEREWLRRTLAAQGHDVLAPAPAQLVPVLDQSPEYELAVVDPHTAPDCVQLVRRRGPEALLIAWLPTGDMAQESLDSGADDFLCGAPHGGALMARIELARRNLGEHKPGDVLNRLLHGADTARLLSQEIGAMFGLPLREEPVNGVIPDLGAELVATCPDTKDELRIAVGLSSDGARSLGLHVFGEPQPEEVLADALREVVNGVGGAFKRMALAQGQTFALGVPHDCPGPMVRDGEREWVAAGDGVGFHVAFHRGLSNVARVPASMLKPGMVLRHEVRTATGVLLVASGMALTEATTTRLRTRFGSTTEFEVLRA